MSNAAGAAWVLDTSDVEEIERDLKRHGSVASSVSVLPEVEVDQSKGRSKRITIPTDDVRPAQPSPVETSWMPMLHPVNLDALVDEAFTVERLARAPLVPREDDEFDDGIDIDIDIDDDDDDDVELDAKVDDESAAPADDESVAKVDDESAAKVADDELDAKVDDESVVEVADESAAPAADESAAPAADESAVKVADESAAPAADESAVEVADESAVEVADESAATVADESAVPVADESAVEVDDESAATADDDELDAKVADESAAPADDESAVAVDEELDDDIDEDIELDEVPSVERQAPMSGEIGSSKEPVAAQESTPDVAGPAEGVTPPGPGVAAPPPMPTYASTSPSTSPAAASPAPEVASGPPLAPKEVSGPPPVPLSAFTGESDRIERSEEAALTEGEDAVSLPTHSGPGDVVEQISEEDVDEVAFEGEDSTSVDEAQPLAFPDDATPPPIPLASATPILPSDGVAADPEEVVPPGPAPTAAPPPAPTAAPPPAPPVAPPPTAAPPPAPEAAPVSMPPQIPVDAKGAARPEPASGPPAVPVTPAAAPKKKRPKKFKKPWFEDFFDDDYLRTIPFMTPSYTVKEMEYIHTHLGLSGGAKLLDVGCGGGRLAIEFSRAGYDVTGLDTSLPLMFQAAEAATAAEVEVNFMHQDMREMSFDSEFDGVYCVMTSFGYFDDDTNRDVVNRMYRALKPGGKLFIEVINRDFILGDLPSRVWWEGDDCVVMDEVEFNFLTSRIVSKRSVVFADGRSVNHDLSIRAYCLHELGRILHTSGFRVVSVTGNINTDNRFFGQYSPYLIVMSEKPK